jgi:hypothetical protein
VLSQWHEQGSYLHFISQSFPHPWEQSSWTVLKNAGKGLANGIIRGRIT